MAKNIKALVIYLFLNIMTFSFLINAILKSIEMILLPLKELNVFSYIIYFVLSINMIIAIFSGILILFNMLVILNKNNKLRVFRFILDFSLILVSISSMAVSRFIAKISLDHELFNFDYSFKMWALVLIFSIVMLARDIFAGESYK